MENYIKQEEEQELSDRLLAEEAGYTDGDEDGLRHDTKPWHWEDHDQRLVDHWNASHGDNDGFFNY